MSSTKLPGADAFRCEVGRQESHEAAGEAATRVAAALLDAAAFDQEINGQQLHDDIPVDKQTFDIGPACQVLRVSPDGLRHAMQAVGATFAGAHNERPYIDGNTLIAVHAYIRDIRRAVAEAK